MTATGPSAPKNDYARRRRRPWLWLLFGLAVSTAVVTVAWMLDHMQKPQQAAPRAGGSVVDLVPGGLTQKERDGASGSLTKAESMRLAQGAWVQVAGADGRVKQQYRAAQINPLPDKRLAMEKPWAVLYGSNGRVVTMRSDTMTAWVPKRELERGKLEGTVVIRVYRPRDGNPVDLAVDPAEMVIEAPEAEFDTSVGEISVDRNVRVTSQALSFEGQGLSLSLSQDGRSIERLVVDRPLSPIRIERSAEMLRQRGEGLRPAGAPAPAPEAGSAAGAAAGSAAGAAAEPGAPAAKSARRAGGEAQARRPYLLTLFDNVSVVSQEKGSRVTMTGKEMRVLFTLEGGVGEGLAGAAQDGAAQDGAANTSLAALCVSGAAEPAPPEEEAITITYTGRLVMMHQNVEGEPLSSPKAVRIEMLGTPARVEDSKSSTVIVARHVRFESIVEDVHLTGLPEDPARLESPDFGISAPALDLNRATGKGGVQGAGTLRMGRADGRAVNVDWGRSASFTLAPGAAEAEGSFRAAQFDGGVRVRGQDFSMDSGTLAVEAEPVGKHDVLRRLVADEGVKATDLGARGGRLEARRVEMLLQPDERGEAQPRAMHATGGVMVADSSQTLWASGLHTAFVAARRPAVPAAPAAQAAARADLGSVIADGPVELLLKDGTHIWASRLEGDATTHTAQLMGPDVLVVRGNSVIDQLTEVHVQEAPGKLSAAGAGRVSYYGERVLAADAGHMDRPALPQLPVMQATWREGLAYAEGAIPGKLGAPDRGLLLLQGAVKVRASRSPLQAESLDADEVQIETAPQVAGKTKPAAPKAGVAPTGGAPDMGEMARMVARGNVRIESREWREGQREAEPRMFRLQSGNATYDVPAGLCSVEGSGTILVNNPPVPGIVPAKAGGDLSFSPEGVTKFTWQRSLGMKNAGPGLTTVALDGSVEMQHLGADDAGTGTLAADHLEATVRGGVAAGAAGAAAPAPAKAKPTDGAPIFGAGATLEELLARGRVTVRTPEYDMEAGEFSLDEAKQVAHLSATPGRAVSIIKRGAAPSGRAQSAVWDMRAGIITIDKLRGTLPR